MPIKDRSMVLAALVGADLGFRHVQVATLLPSTNHRQWMGL